MPSKTRTWGLCRQRSVRLAIATVSIAVRWRHYEHGVGCDHAVRRPTTAFAPFFVPTLPDPPLRLFEWLIWRRKQSFEGSIPHLVIGTQALFPGV